MEIRSPERAPKTFHDYDFTFTNGLFMSFSVDIDAGDKIIFDADPTKIMIFLASKPSPASPTDRLPAEMITVFTDKLMAIQHRERIVNPLPAEIEASWKKTLQEMSKTVN